MKKITFLAGMFLIALGILIVCNIPTSSYATTSDSQIIPSESIGTFDINSCVNLIQMCDLCSYVNINSIIYPDNNITISNISMTKTGNIYNYTFCDTNMTGTYYVLGSGDPAGISTSWDYTFIIGTEKSTTGWQGSLIAFYLGGGVVLLLLAWYTQAHLNNSILKIIIKYLTITLVFSLLLIGIIQVQLLIGNANGTNNLSSIQNLATTTYTVMFWFFIFFFLMLLLSFFIEALLSFGSLSKHEKFSRFENTRFSQNGK